MSSSKASPWVPRCWYRSKSTPVAIRDKREIRTNEKLSWWTGVHTYYFSLLRRLPSPTSFFVLRLNRPSRYLPGPAFPSSPTVNFPIVHYHPLRRPSSPVPPPTIPQTTPCSLPWSNPELVHRCSNSTLCATKARVGVVEPHNIGSVHLYVLSSAQIEMASKFL